MVFLLVIWSPKQSEIEKSSLESMAKQWKAQKHEEPKLWSFRALFHKQIMNERRKSKERNPPWSIQKDSHCQPLLEHFLELKLCILYVVSKLGSHQSNDSNGVLFGVEMKELQPLEADHFKLKANFAGLWNQPLATKWCPLCCEISPPSCTAAKFPKASRYLRSTFWDFFALDIWCLNPQTLLVIHLS